MAGVCYISTGQKQVLHTLWECKYNMVHNEMFVKNLSSDRNKAVAEAKRYAKEHGLDFDGIWNSPRFKKAEHFEKYGVVFKHKRKKGKSFYQGFPGYEFWDEWKKDKQKLKDEGFFVSQYRNPFSEKKELIWYVFYKPGGKK